MSHIILWNSYGHGLQTFEKKVFNIGHLSTVRPLGAHQLAFWLRQNGYTVVVIDFCNLIQTDKLVDITESYITNDTIAIGASRSFWMTDKEPGWVIHARSKIENKYPSIKWILGGARETECDHSWITFNSYSEDSVLDFLTQNKSNKKFDIKKSHVQYSDLDFITPSEVLPYELGRGCKFKCKFCAYPMIGKKPGTYIKDMHLVREQLLRIYEQYGVTRYNFIDDTVNEDDEKIDNLARLAQSLPFELEWVGYCRADLIWSRPHMIKTLKDSGLRSVFFGIESFHPEASKIVGKGWSGKHAKEFLLRLKDEWGEEISMSLGLIVGLPGEPLDSLDEHNEWLMKNDIGRWAWTTLGVSNDKKYKWTSEFERNHDKYGIQFYGENSTHWYHSLCDRNQAEDKTRDLLIKSTPAHRNCGFSLSDYCTTTGTPYKESMKIKLIDMMTKKHYDFMISCLKSNVDKYVHNHLNRS